MVHAGGRPPKPIEVKRRLGNPGKRPLPKSGITALAPIVRIAPPARGLSGTELVQSILDAGGSAWIGATDQPALLTLLAEGWDERARLRAALFDGPLFDLDPKAAIAWAVAQRMDLRALEKQITQWLSLLGLTPTDRSRLGVAEVKARTKLEELRSRRGTRDGRHVG